MFIDLHLFVHEGGRCATPQDSGTITHDLKVMHHVT